MIVATKYRRVILNPENIGLITTVIPTADVIRYQGREVVAVPHRIDEVRVLNNLGFKVPSPITFYHEWKAPFEAFEAQKITAGMLTLNPRAYVLNELGTGKTQALLWAADYLMKVGIIHRVLVVCTMSTMERAWGDEIFRGFMHRTALQVYGTPKRRLKVLSLDADFYILNHHGLKVEGMVEALQDRPDIDLVIVDELAVFRNSRSDLYHALERVINGEDTRKRRRAGKPWAWGATAKPTPTEPTDAWAQCRLITPNTVPRYFSHFRDLVMMRFGPYKWQPRVNAADLVAEAMRPAVRFTRAQCYDIKEPIYETRHADMSPDQKRVYHDLQQELIAEYEAGQITAVNEAVKIGKLVQVASGVAYGQDKLEIQIPCPDRLAVLAELMDEATAKIIIYAPFKCTVRMLETWLAEQGRKVGVVTGETSKNARDTIFSQFQNRTHEMDTLLAQPGTMAHGLTLTAADMIIWWAPLDNNEIYEQANGRFTRFDQQAQPIVAHIEASPAERAVYNRLKNHQNFQNLVLELIEQSQNVLVLD